MIVIQCMSVIYIYCFVSQLLKFSMCLEINLAYWLTYAAKYLIFLTFDFVDSVSFDYRLMINR